MKNFTRIFLAALALLAVCAPLAYSDDDDGHPADSDRPQVTARSASNVSESAATLRATIDPEDDDDDDDDDDDGDRATTYYFQYGPAAASAYGFQTPSVTLYDDDKTTVSAQVTGLTPGTVYRFHAVAFNVAGTDYGSNVTFRTAGNPPVGGGQGREPVMGRTVVAEAVAGEVLVREEGTTEFHPLESAQAMPVNSTFDTRHGTVELETARGHGRTQTGTFRGGLFKVRQSRSGHGMTNIALRGGSFAACGSGPASRARATFRRRSPVRKLWAKDRGGKFKTSGKGSVATVRGTSWYTADRCDGTLTKVKHGAVLVREKGTGRSRLLHKGQSFLARIKR